MTYNIIRSIQSFVKYYKNGQDTTMFATAFEELQAIELPVSFQVLVYVQKYCNKHNWSAKTISLAQWLDITLASRMNSQERQSLLDRIVLWYVAQLENSLQDAKDQAEANLQIGRNQEYNYLVMSNQIESPLSYLHNNDYSEIEETDPIKEYIEYEITHSLGHNLGNYEDDVKYILDNDTWEGMLSNISALIPGDIARLFIDELNEKFGLILSYEDFGITENFDSDDLDNLREHLDKSVDYAYEKGYISTDDLNYFSTKNLTYLRIQHLVIEFLKSMSVNAHVWDYELFQNWLS